MADALKIGDRVSLDILMRGNTFETVEFVILDRAPAMANLATRADTARGGGTGQRWWLQVASTGELMQDAVRESRLRLVSRFGPEPLTNDMAETLESAA